MHDKKISTEIHKAGSQKKVNNLLKEWDRFSSQILDIVTASSNNKTTC